MKTRCNRATASSAKRRPDGIAPGSAPLSLGGHVYYVLNPDTPVSAFR